MESDKNCNKSRRELEKEYEIHLIAEIESRPCLYDKNHEFYSNQKSRMNAWNEISTNTNKTVEDLKKRWETLRDSYRKFRRRLTENNDQCSVKWIHYDKMKFLEGHIKLDFNSLEVNDNQKELDTKLIAEIVKRKNLYDPLNETFRNMRERTKTWEQISSVMVLPASLCKKRWNYLRDTFRRLSRTESNDAKKVNWVHYENLKFLLQYDLASSSTVLPPDANFENTFVYELDQFAPPTKFENDINDQNFVKPDRQKCGEIFFGRNQHFFYKCSVCNTDMQSIDSFIEHFLYNHNGQKDNSLFESGSFELNDEFFDKDNPYISGEQSNLERSNICDESMSYIEEQNDIKNVDCLISMRISNTEIDTTSRSNSFVVKQETILHDRKSTDCIASMSLDKEDIKNEPGSPSSDNAERLDESGMIKCEYTGERSYQCRMCEQNFKNFDNLKDHYIFQHNEDRPYFCQHEGCDKKFKTMKTRTEHEILHKNELRFQCDVCGKCFPRSSYLKRHQNTWHMQGEDRRFKCEHCTKSFCTQQNLRYHVYTHTGERPFACPMCPSKFTKPWTVKEHMKIHSGKRNYVCQVCGAGFNQVAGLIKHKKRHDHNETLLLDVLT